LFFKIPSNLKFWFDDPLVIYDPNLPLINQICLKTPIHFLPINYQILQFNWLGTGIGSLEIGKLKEHFPDQPLLCE